MKDLVDVLLKKFKSLDIIAVIIILFTSTCLFANKNIIKILGVENFIIKYKMYIGIGFIISLIYLLIAICTKFYNLIKNKIKKHANIKFLRKQLDKLTNEEKEILKYYIDNQTKTQKLSYTNGVVRGLEGIKVIYRASNVSSPTREYYGMIFSYNIQPWAWDYLNEHKELLEINSNISTDNSINL